MSNMFARGIQASWLASLRRPTNRFIAAVRDPEKAQARKLLTILVRNAGTSYGREHGFGRVGTVADWQARVPLVDYTAVAPWVDRIAAGEDCVLTREPVLMLEPTAGTTGPPKLLPYTSDLLDELLAATGPWLFEAYRQWPKILGTRSYWSASSAGRVGGETAGGVPIGQPTDSVYFGPVEGWANARLTAGAHTEGFTADDPEPDPLDIARNLLLADDLGFISVWSPADLTELLVRIQTNLDPLVASLPDARATNLRGALNAAGRVTVPALWPSLAMVSCWADAPSTAEVESLREFMPTTPIQPKGLCATEGVVTVPLGASEGALAAVDSHFLEFLDLEAPTKRPKLVHEVQEGARYSPVLTTSGGLYRYQLGDIMRCIGHTEVTPRFVVEGRLSPPEG